MHLAHLTPKSLQKFKEEEEEEEDNDDDDDDDDLLWWNVPNIVLFTVSLTLTNKAGTRFI